MWKGDLRIERGTRKGNRDMNLTGSQYILCTYGNVIANA
jgi:hypothetical protein